MWQTRVCRECQQEFSIRDKKQWAYKERIKDHGIKWFCSYKCLREYKRGKIRDVVSGRFNGEIWRNTNDSVEMVQTKESAIRKNR